jgi:hypothetical protein
VTAKVLCAAGGPWGLVSTIEGIMAQQALASVQSFLNFCTEKCTEGTQQLRGYTSDAETVEFYQDAAETFLGAHSLPAELAGACAFLLSNTLSSIVIMPGAINVRQTNQVFCYLSSATASEG